MFSHIYELIFPRKCVLCRNILSKDETDLCRSCRATAPEFTKPKRNISFVAQWTAIWYYKGNVRSSIHRFKFGNARGYAEFYARQLAVKLQETEFLDKIDILTWVPISPIRRFARGYDQSQLLTQALGKELGLPVIRTLRKVRHTPPQSAIKHAAQRRANILNAYKPYKPERFSGLHILLLDDIITTGSTASECAKTLLINNVKEVTLAAIAAAPHDKSK